MLQQVIERRERQKAAAALAVGNTVAAESLESHATSVAQTAAYLRRASVANVSASQVAFTDVLVQLVMDYTQNGKHGLIAW
jgi:hypothetical protein